MQLLLIEKQSLMENLYYLRERRALIKYEAHLGLQ